MRPAPADPALGLFTRATGLPSHDTAPPGETLRAVLRAFARLPYENLTKILADAASGNAAQARRTPFDVLRDHAAWGTGGTCFSLTATLRHLLRALGFDAEPLLADRPYGPDTHCALAVWLDGAPHLVDPGYLLVEPVPLSAADPQRVRTSFNEIDLVPRAGGRLELHTVARGTRSLRMTFKTEPVDWGQFLNVWDDSFDWEMMRYPVVTQVRDGRHVYLQGNRLQVRGGERVERTELDPAQLSQRIAATFGIDAGVVRRALATLRSRGGIDGRP